LVRFLLYLVFKKEFLSQEELAMGTDTARRFGVPFAVWTLALGLILSSGCATSSGQQVCTPDEERRCGSDVGACRAGWQQCDAGGQWGECIGALYPGEELCDGVDNDCDAVTDELVRACQNSCGVEGTERCQYGEWVCDVLDELEECGDGLDNDCDGAADEGCNCLQGLERLCGTDVGGCIAGVQFCKDARWTICEGAVGPQPEICDGEDNDCDGEVDEDLTRMCTMGTDMQKCINGSWTECVGVECPPCDDPQTEICDGLDNDCDCMTDEVYENCTNECTTGVRRCEDGVWGDCTAPGPGPEVCNCLDDDCDGLTDEELEETPCSTSCGEGMRRCHQCRMRCDAPEPEPEECDNKDNDCNGVIDDALTQSCEVVCTESGTVLPGSQECEDGVWQDCVTDEPCPH
jgi:hypothetical protein